MRLLVTGGAGFIGSNFVKYMLREHPDYEIVNIDKLNYAGKLEYLQDISHDPRHIFYHADICNREVVRSAMKGCDAVINFAAESHVDRSIFGPINFIDPNVRGVITLLEEAKRMNIQKFIQISTDEVYGELDHGFFKENEKLEPRNPYAASKAAAEMIVRSYYYTYKVPVIITRSSNNYGPHQYPEKLIPFALLRAFEDKPVLIHGNGSNIRSWLYVLDNCRAVDLVLQKGEVGETYNISSNIEKSNLEVVQSLLREVQKPETLIKFVADRPWNDTRYGVETTKIRKLGWEPEYGFEKGLKLTVKWYAENAALCKSFLDFDEDHPMKLTGHY